MTAFVLRRLLIAIPLLLAVVVLLFFLFELVPGDASLLFMSPDFPATKIEQIRRNLGLDGPAIERLGRWLVNVAQLDFQFSLKTQRPVGTMILEALGPTLLLSFLSLTLIFSVGVVVGIISAVKQYSATDIGLTLGALFFYSMPSFWLALMLQLIISLIYSKWPISGMTSGSIMGGTQSFFARVGDIAQHLILPAFALGIPPAAGVARYARSSMLEVIRQDYVRTAQAKGVPPARVILRHALRNALIPVITLLGLYLPFLISGAVLVETIFAWPGMGKLLVYGVFQRDVPVVLAATLLLSAMVILGNLVSDLLYAVVDPRIRYA